MIKFTDTFNIKLSNFDYNLTQWGRYRRFTEYNQFPDHYRFGFDKNGFECFIGFRLNKKNYIKYTFAPEECIWYLYQEDSFNNFQPIIDWYNFIYKTTEIKFNEIELAKNRIDNLLIKYKKLMSFT